MGSVQPENWLGLAKINPEFEKALQALPEVPKLSGTIQHLRKVLSDAKEALSSTQSKGNPDITERDTTIPARDGYSIPVRIYTPKSPPAGGSPLVVMLHGGGFCLGGLENEELSCRNFAQYLGCVCVNVDYRLAPEHPFPTPVDDCWDVVKWVAAHAAELQADLSKGFIVGGTSAGGNLSAVVGLLARDEKLSPPLTGLYLSIPTVLSKEVVPAKYQPLYLSYEQNKDAAVLPASTMDLFIENYKPDQNSWHFNAFNHPDGHAGLPPVFFQVCGMDPLRDEALIYEKVLREDYGVQTKLDIYPGLPHGFWSFFPGMQVSTEFVEDIVNGVGWLLGRNEDVSKDLSSNST